MVFHSLIDAPSYRDDFVCRMSRVKEAIAPAVFGVLALLALALARHGGYYKHNWNAPAGLGYWTAFVMAGMMCLALVRLRASFHPANWVLRITTTGVLIKYRSFMNRHFPVEDLQVVEFRYDELAGVRRVHEFRPVTGPTGKKRTESLTCLELTLRTAAGPELAEQLQIEIDREAPMVHHQSTKWCDYPVTVVDGGRAIRVRWNMVTPGINAAIAELERRLPVRRADTPV